MKLAIGTANFLKKYSYKNKLIKKKELIKILKFSLKNKIVNLDTAFSYDKFSILKNEVDFRKFKISTKINLSKKLLKKLDFEKKIFLNINKKLTLFKINNFDIFYIHNFDEINNIDLVKIKNIFLNLKKKNKIKKIGISIYDKTSLKKIKYFDCVDIIQVPINVVDTKFTSKNVLNFLKKKKIKIYARSIFLQGLLLDEIKSNQNKNLIYNQTLIDFKKWLKKHNISALNSCVSFIKNQKYLDGVVVGMENYKQFIEILEHFKDKKKYDYPKRIYSLDKEIIDPRNWKRFK